MHYRRFGQTEQQLSIFSFGAMRYMESEENAVATVKAAVDAGINHLETARGYGESERMMGLAFEEVDRGSIYLETKIGPTDTADEFRRCLDESLARMKVTWIDNLAVHGINTQELLDKTLQRDGALAAAQRAQAEGIVRHIGFSTHAPREIILNALNTEAFEFVNLHYYYFQQRNRPAVERATELDMGVFIISPTDKGGQLFRPSDKLRRMSGPWTPLQLNHRFLLSDPRIHTLSLGAAHPEEIAEHIVVADEDGPLTPEESAAFAALDAEPARFLGNTLCSQCYDCLPCPEDVHIPEVLRLRNLARTFDMEQFGQYRYGMLGNAGHWYPGANGAACTDCGDCLPRCPEKLPIPALLRDTHEILSGEQGKRLWE